MTEIEDALTKMADLFNVYAANEQALRSRGYHRRGGKVASQVREETWRDAAADLRSAADDIRNDRLKV